MTPADMIAGLLFALTLPHIFNTTAHGGIHLFPWSRHDWFRGKAELRSALQDASRAALAAEVRQVLECARASAAFALGSPFWLENGLIWGRNDLDSIQFRQDQSSRIKVNQGESR